jgi:hypothetical protein
VLAGLAPFVALAFLPIAPCEAGAAERTGPPLELVASNVRDTPYTAVVEITGVEKADAIRGYVRFRVRASVIETIKGKAVARIEYFETHEAPSKGPERSSRVLVSLQEAPDGALSVSDNGYVFPANEAVIREARKAARGLHHQH